MTPRNQPLGWLGWTAAAFPVAVLSHEAAHFAVYLWFGFSGAALHYGSASFAAGDAFWKQLRAGDAVAAAQIAPLWQVGLASAAGLFATYLTLAGCLLVVRHRAHPFVVALGLIAGLRFLGSVVVVAQMILGGGGGNGSDEEHVALTMHVPELALHLLGIVALMITWGLLLRIPRRDGKRSTLAMFGGMIVGGVAYIGLIGPWLLP